MFQNETVEKATNVKLDKLVDRVDFANEKRWARRRSPGGATSTKTTGGENVSFGRRGRIRKNGAIKRTLENTESVKNDFFEKK